MRITPRGFATSIAGLLALGITIAACSDQNDGVIAPPDGQNPFPRLAELLCVGDVQSRTVSCRDESGPEPSGANRTLMIVGGQGTYVQLTSSNISVDPDGATQSIFSFDAQLQNLLRQPFGTTDADSLSPHVDGVRIFFHQLPTVTAGTGSVTVDNADGTDTYTAGGQPYFQYDSVSFPTGPRKRSSVRWQDSTNTRRWELRLDNTVTTFEFKVYVVSEVPFFNGWVDAVPNAATVRRTVADTVFLLPAGSTTLTGTARDKVGAAAAGTITFASSNALAATVNPVSGLVTAVDTGMTVITATSTAPARPNFRRTVVIVNTPVDAVRDSVEALGNVAMSYPVGFSVLNNDTDADNDALTVTTTSVTTAEGGSATFQPDGSFTYLSAPGFSGKDSVRYSVTDGDAVDSAVVVLQVGTRYWYVQPKAASAGTGTSASPFNTLQAADAASSGSESILVLAGGAASPADNGIVLNAGQPLIGQGRATNLTTTVMSGALPVTLLTAGAYPQLNRTTAGATVTVGANSTVEGVRIASSNGHALTGSGFTAVTLSRLRIFATGGAALNLDNGAVSAPTALDSVSSSGGANALSFSTVTGSLTANAGLLETATGHTIQIAGGSISLTYSGFITHNTAGTALLSVTGSHSGTLTFQTGSLFATNGLGLQFNAANGNYNFDGTTTMNGGDAAIDILNGSAGTFSFGTGVSVTSPSGTAFTLANSTAGVTYSGDLTQGNSALLVNVVTRPSGTLTFQTGTLSATNGTGITLSDVDGTVNFNGTTTLNGGDAGVDVVLDSDGTFSFGSGASIANPTGIAFNVTTSTPVSLTYAGTISVNAERAAVVNGGSASCGVVTLSGNITSGSGGRGIEVTGCTAGTVSFNGTSKSLSTGAQPAVSLTSNPGGAINFGNGGLAISTTTASGFAASGGGTIQVTGTNNTIASTTGTALSLNGVAAGAGNVTFHSVAANGAANGINLNNLSGSGGVVVTGDGSTNGTGGTIQNTTSHSVSLTSLSGLGGGVTLNRMIISGAGAGGSAGILGTTFGTLNATGTSVASTGGPALSLSTGAANATFSSVSASGSANGIALTGVTGTLNISAGTIAGAAGGAAISVSGGTVGGTLSANASQAANNTLISVSGGHATGTLTFAGTLGATNGNGLQFDNADGTYAFTGTTTLNGGDAGIDVLNGSSGTFTFPTATTITNPTGSLITVQSSAPTFTYTGGFTKNNNATGAILVASNTGGTITFNGDGTTLDGDPADVTKTINTTGAGIAVSMTSNGAATINFSGGGLGITSASGNGFNATGSGTVNVTGFGNTISSGTGTALSISSVTVGASGVTFRSVTAAGGSNGIFLSNTGNSGGGIQVTGDGATAGSGGSITNMTGADGATAGNGIYMSSARRVSFSWMSLSGHANNGLYGVGVRGLTLDKMRFTGTIGNSNSNTFAESPVHLDDVGGAVKMTRSRFDGGAFNSVKVENISGTAPTLDSLVLENDTAASMQGSTADVRGTALLVTLNDGTADVRIRDNRVTQWWGNGIHVLIQGTASGTTRITNNFVDNTNGALAGAGGIWVSGGSHAYNISGNTVRHTNGTAISADRVATGALMQGTIDGNFVGVSGDANSGSFTGIGIFASQHGTGTTTVKISNNVLRQINGSASGAITTQSGDASGFGGSGTMNATISGNNIQESGTTVNNAQHGILVTHGTQSGPPNDTDQGCYDVVSNTIINFVSGTANNRMRVNQRFGTTSRWPGYTGAATGATSQTDMATYLLGRNTASTSTNANTSTGGFLNTSPAGSACPQPSI